MNQVKEQKQSINIKQDQSDISPQEWVQHLKLA